MYIHSFIYIFIHSFIHPSVRSIDRSFVRSVINLVCKFINSFIYSFVRQLKTIWRRYLKRPLILSGQSSTIASFIHTFFDSCMYSTVQACLCSFAVIHLGILYASCEIFSRFQNGKQLMDPYAFIKKIENVSTYFQSFLSIKRDVHKCKISKHVIKS